MNKSGGNGGGSTVVYIVGGCAEDHVYGSDRHLKGRRSDEKRKGLSRR